MPLLSRSIPDDDLFAPSIARSRKSCSSTFQAGDVCETAEKTDKVESATPFDKISTKLIDTFSSTEEGSSSSDEEERAKEATKELQMDVSADACTPDIASYRAAPKNQTSQTESSRESPSRSESSQYSPSRNSSSLSPLSTPATPQSQVHLCHSPFPTATRSPHKLASPSSRHDRVVQQSRAFASDNGEVQTKQGRGFNMLDGLLTNKPQEFCFSRLETLILLDWDDTLFPSSWLTENQLSLDANPSASQHALLNSISDAACSLLVTAMHCGRVVIVTNAETGWVEISSRKFLPRVFNLLNALKVLVISARSEFETPERQHPVQWKLQAFKYLLRLVFPTGGFNPAYGKRNQSQFARTKSEQRCARNCSSSSQMKHESNGSIQPNFFPCKNQSSDQMMNNSNFSSPTASGKLSRPSARSSRCCCQASSKVDAWANIRQQNVLSIGDSDSERLALIQCVQTPRSEDTLALYKSFKLCEHPGGSLLLRQLHLVQKLLPSILQHVGNLDLQIQFCRH